MKQVKIRKWCTKFLFLHFFSLAYALPSVVSWTSSVKFQVLVQTEWHWKLNSCFVDCNVHSMHVWHYYCFLVIAFIRKFICFIFGPPICGIALVPLKMSSSYYSATALISEVSQYLLILWRCFGFLNVCFGPLVYFLVVSFNSTILYEALFIVSG